MRRAIKWQKGAVMERLTNKKYGENSCEGVTIPYSTYCIGCITIGCNCGIVEDMVKKLADYENLEERGRLIKLPIEDKKDDCRECVHTKTQCHHMEYKCSECPLTELFCDEFYLAIDRCYEDAYANGCLAGMDLAESEAEAKLKELRYDND
jgi:hypothetical protein